MKTLYRKHYIQNPTTKKKCRVYYSLDNRVDGKKCVTLYAKGHLDYMDGIIDFTNHSDGMVDYFEKDRAVIFEDNPQYAEVRALVENLHK